MELKQEVAARTTFPSPTLPARCHHVSKFLLNEHGQEFHMPCLCPAAKAMKVHSGTSSPLPSGWHSFTGVTGRRMVLKMTEPLAVRDNE